MASYVFQSCAITPSPYSGLVSDGARAVRFHTLPEALATMIDLARNERGKAYLERCER